MKQPMKIDHRYVTFRVDPTRSACRVDFIDTAKRAVVEQVFVNLGEGDRRKSFVDMSEFMGMTLDVQMLPCESEWALQPEGVLTEEEAETRRRFIACEDDYLSDKEKDEALRRVRDEAEKARVTPTRVLPARLTQDGAAAPADLCSLRYREPYRPLYHFTTQRGWINDPNGCIYFDGLWHLYYQHCPGSTESMWDNNHWGHAVSRDLFTWEEREPVLRFPHQASGTGFIDRETGRVCVTTSNLIFESPDGGFKYDFKSYNTAGCGDPKIFWHEESGRYISITLRDVTSYQISSSPDLVEWRHESDIENFRECPEFAKYRIEGTDEYKWVLCGGDGAYQYGEFDGHEFKPDPIEDDRLDRYVHVMEATRHFNHKYNGYYIDDTQPDTENRYSAYAFQNFDNAPAWPDQNAPRVQCGSSQKPHEIGSCSEFQVQSSKFKDGDPRHVRIAWYTVDFKKYGELFTQAMTVPQEMTLRRTPLGLRLCAMPVDEIKAHYSGEWAGDEFECDCTEVPGRAFDVEASFPAGGRLKLGPYELSYLPDAQKIRVVQYASALAPLSVWERKDDGSYALRDLPTVSGRGDGKILADFTVPFIPGEDGEIRVRALFDVLTAEFFFGDGEVYLPLKPDDPDRPEGIFVSCDREARIKVCSIERTMKQ